jgi:hypothetical protein
MRMRKKIQLKDLKRKYHTWNLIIGLLVFNKYSVSVCIGFNWLKIREQWRAIINTIKDLRVP